ncbi:MAG: mechanosensitive ion channel domain-containing protein [Pseudomonas sp.]
MLTVVQSYPLILGAFLLLLDLASWHLAPFPHQIYRVATRLMLFLLYSGVIFNTGLSPLLPPPWPDEGTRQLAATALAIIWWIFAARTLTVVFGMLLLRRIGHSGRLLQDVMGAVIFLIAVVAAAGYVLLLPVQGLLATSGAVAIIVGLALQSTLSDVFSGIVLNTTKPYQIDDVVSIDGVEGKVLDIDWRSTHLLTGSGSTAVIPNSVAAKAKIINLSRPADVHGVSIRIAIPAQVRPRRVLDALERALQGNNALLTSPAPKAFVDEAGTTTIHYMAVGAIPSLDKKVEVRSLMFDLAHRHLEAAGIAWLSEVPIEPIPRTRALIEEIKIFRGINAEEKETLAQTLTKREYAVGQVILDVGEVSEFLYVIGTGVVSASVRNGSAFVEVGRMGPTEVMGEQSMLGDAPSDARFTAMTSCIIYRIEKSVTLQCMEQRVEIKAALSKLQAVRQQSTHSMLFQKPSEVKKTGLLSWLNKR